MLTVHSLYKRLARVEEALDITHSEWRKCYAISGKLFQAQQTSSIAVRNEWLVDACVALDSLEASMDHEPSKFEDACQLYAKDQGWSY